MLLENHTVSVYSLDDVTQVIKEADLTLIRVNLQAVLIMVHVDAILGHILVSADHGCLGGIVWLWCSVHSSKACVC